MNKGVKREYTYVQAYGDSMLPLIKDGDSLKVERFDLDDPLHIFDIVVYKYKANFFCHFVWSENQSIGDKYSKQVSIRSLNSGTKIFYVDRESIVGKVVNYRLGSFLKIKLILSFLFFRS